VVSANEGGSLTGHNDEKSEADFKRGRAAQGMSDALFNEGYSGGDPGSNPREDCSEQSYLGGNPQVI
jgi:hypothetical protein